MGARILVVNGWSNSGKTSFAKWLATKHGFTHVDADKDGIESNNLGASWAKVLHQNDATEFRDELQGRTKSTVMDWPYNQPWGLRWVVALQNAGIPVWWLDADPDAARESFIKRAERPLEEFTAHAEGNQQWRPVIERIYGDRRLRTLEADGVRLAPQEIWARVCKREGW